MPNTVRTPCNACPRPIAQPVDTGDISALSRKQVLLTGMTEDR